MANTIQFKRGLSANRTSITPLVGQPLFDTDTKKFYIGDGTTAGGLLVGARDFLPIAGIDATKIISGTIDIARIPVLPSQKTIVSSGGIANLTTEQQNQIGEGTIVTTTDGNRWVYNGSGSKVLEASYTVLADITPEWSVIANKPSLVNTFNTRSGAIVPQSGDYNTSQVTENTNLYFTNARAQSAMTGAISTVTTSNLTVSRALVSDASGKVAVSAVTGTELGYLTGVTSAIQTQINAKEPTLTAGTTSQYYRGDKSWQTLNTTAVTEGTNQYFTNARAQAAMTGAISTVVTSNIGSTNSIMCTNSDGKISATDITVTQIGYLRGTFSAYQQQYNGLTVFALQAYGTKTYRQIFTMPASGSSNYTIVQLKGTVGGFTFAQGKADIDIIFTSRDYTRPTATIVGTLGISDIEMYRNADNSFSIYAVANVGSMHPWNLSAHGDFSGGSNGATYSYDYSAETTTTPTGTLEWKLSTGFTTRSYYNSAGNTGFVVNSDVASTNTSFLFQPVNVIRNVLTSYSDGLFKYRAYSDVGVEIDQPFTVDNAANGDITVGNINRSVRLSNYIKTHNNMDPGTWDIAAKTITGTNFGWNREPGAQKTTFINRVASSTIGGYSFRWYDSVTPTERTLLDLNYLGDATFAGKIIKSGGTTSQFLKANGDVDSTVYVSEAAKTREIVVAMEGINNSAPSVINFVDANNSCLGFNGNATTNNLYGSIDTQHDYIAGTDLVVHVHWAPTTTTGGNVKWGLYYSWCETGGTWAAATLATATTAAGTTAWADKLSTFTISGSGHTYNSRLKLRLFRNPSDAADTYPDNAAYIQLGVHYQANLGQA